MQAKEVTFFKVLCNRFHKGPLDALFPAWLESLKQQIQAETSNSQDVYAIVESPEILLSKIHYSWLAPFIEKLDPKEHDILIASLPDPQQQGIRRILKKKNIQFNLIPGLKRVVQQKLLKEVLGTQNVPIGYINQTSLTPLLNLDKTALVNMIECLGIYDLTEEMRKVVDRHRLKLIYAALNPLEQQFLRQCLQYKNRLQSFGMDLHSWSGSVADLKQQLHRRGMARLGRSLSGQPPQLIWQVVHTLDIGRGNRVERWIAPQVKEGITSALIGQVLNVMNFLQKRAM